MAVAAVHVGAAVSAAMPMEPDMTYRIANLALVVALVLTAVACTDPREQRRSAQRTALTSQLQETDAAYAQAVQAMQAHSRQLQALQDERSGLQSQAARLKREVQTFMMDHKMAVAALAAGVAGTGMALDDSGQFTDEARTVAGVVGIVAVGWALFNMEEVAQVASELMKAEAMAKALADRQRAVASALADEQAALQQAQALHQQVQGRLATLRTALAAL